MSPRSRRRYADRRERGDVDRAPTNGGLGLSATAEAAKAAIDQLTNFIISLYWRGHHRLYRYVTDAPPHLWLFAVILTPYATRVLYGGQDISHSDFPWRFAFHAVVQAFSAAAFVLAEREIQQRRLYTESMPPGLLERGLTINGVLVVSFLMSIPVAFAVYAWAFAIWTLIPVFIVLVTRIGRRRTARAGSST